MKKILVVDDIKGWRDYHISILLQLIPDARFFQAETAREAYDLLLEHNENPFDIILTDMQMENDFEPKYAGEWLIEQIKTFRNYDKTNVVIISAAYNIQHIAESNSVGYIRKQTARNFPDSYSFLAIE